jgi:transcriptional regulator
VYGRPAIIDDPLRVRDLLETTVQHFEANFAEPWTTDRLAEAYLTTLSAGIVAFELPIEHLEGKRKLSQNRSPADIRGTVAGLRARGEPGGVAIAELMSPIEARQ